MKHWHFFLVFLPVVAITACTASDIEVKSDYGESILVKRSSISSQPIDLQKISKEVEPK